MPVRNADGYRRMDDPPVHKAISYDVGLSFIDHPVKTLLPAGTSLVRLDFPIDFALFMKVWWMRTEVLNALLHPCDPDAAALRREWQKCGCALPKASKGYACTRIVVEIVLTEQVYAWLGKA